MSINTIIVDDEKPARDELAFLLKGFPEINVIGQGKNGVEAVSLIKEHTPDLVFLDVKMPGLDGFGVLKKIVERKMKMPHVVFATAFDQYAVQAFDVNAVDYVLKPFDKARIAKAIARARKMLETQTSATERLEQLEPLGGGSLRLQHFAGPRNGLGDARLVERLQHVVHGIYIECLDRVLVKRSGKDHVRHFHFALDDFFQDAKTVQTGHFHVQ